MRDKIRLVATDIEGTLIDDQRELHRETVRVLRTLAADGLPVLLVTGYNPWPVLRLMSLLGPEIEAICLNGIFLICNGEIQPGLLLDPAVARNAAIHMAVGGYVPLVYGTDGVTRYLPLSAEGMAVVKEVMATRSYQPYQAVETIEELFVVTPAQVSVCDTEERGTALRARLAKALGEDAYLAFSVGKQTWVEVNHPQARKDTALLAWAAARGIAAEAIAYFGDNLNDLGVFQQVGYPVAVANARPEILELARELTVSNNELGVARKLVEWFGLEPVGEG